MGNEDDDIIKVLSGEIIKEEIKECKIECTKYISVVEKEVIGVKDDIKSLIKLNATLLVGIIVTLVAVLMK